MPKPAPPLAAFRRAYFGPIDQQQAWHEGIEADLACLDALAPAAQAAAELLAALRAGTADARAMLGLGHLRCEEALPLLHDCLRRGSYGLYALGAIAAINPAGLYPQLVAGLLQAKINEFQLVNLLVGLREYFTLPPLGPAVPPRIFALLAHADSLVRYHALHTLRLLYGLQTAAQQRAVDRSAVLNDEVFGLLISDKKPADFRRAQQLLLAQLPAATVAQFPLV